MTDFDTMLTNDIPAFMVAFGKETEANYRPNGRENYSITIMYDQQILAFDPLLGDDVDLKPFITMATADIREEAREGDDIEFEGIRVEVEFNMGDNAGFTTLRVRKTN